MIVLGLDLSTKSGVVALRCNKFGSTPEVLSAQVVSAPEGLTRMDRAESIAVQIGDIMAGQMPDLVVVENYGFRNSHTLALLVEIGTMVRHVIRQYEVPHIEVTPKTVKKFVSGNGSADKKLMAKATKERWGFDHKSNDVVDAHGLAMYGLAKKGLLKLSEDQINSIV